MQRTTLRRCLRCLAYEKTLEEDLDFVDDDLCLISCRTNSNIYRRKLTCWLKRQGREGRQDFLDVNMEKTDVMEIPNQQQRQQTPITINGRNLKGVVTFTYLPTKSSSFQLQTAAQMSMSKSGLEKQQTKPPLNNLKSVWRSTALHSAKIVNNI
ncbi:unnamed protein product [Heterobilharzia americana]|nr:unnamed protein product [Heterobilharzia americana]